ncbi:MAG: 2'-5' RNA ligase family protein [Ginsengibacter sp.]
MDTKKLSPVDDKELYEYLLVAHPDIHVHEKVMAQKKLFFDEYKQKVAITKPHITVANFVAREEMEDTIIRWVQRICSSQQSFTVALNNYSGFPPHTIYLRVQNAKPFQQLGKELNVVNNYVSSCSCPPMKIISKPHVSIAGSLSNEVYFKALIQYAHKSFHESFVVSELLLLRRKHKDDICKRVNVFGLQPANELFT